MERLKILIEIDQIEEEEEEASTADASTKKQVT